jgi:hypothetical protein
MRPPRCSISGLAGFIVLEVSLTCTKLFLYFWKFFMVLILYYFRIYCIQFNIFAICITPRYPHIEKDHLVKLLKQLITSATPPLHGKVGRNPPNAADVPTLLGSGPFSLLDCMWYKLLLLIIYLYSLPYLNEEFCIPLTQWLLAWKFRMHMVLSKQLCYCERIFLDDHLEADTIIWQLTTAKFPLLIDIMNCFPKWFEFQNPVLKVHYKFRILMACFYCIHVSSNKEDCYDRLN